MTPKDLLHALLFVPVANNATSFALWSPVFKNRGNVVVRAFRCPLSTKRKAGLEEAINHSQSVVSEKLMYPSPQAPGRSLNHTAFVRG